MAPPVEPDIIECLSRTSSIPSENVNTNVQALTSANLMQFEKQMNRRRKSTHSEMGEDGPVPELPRPNNNRQISSFKTSYFSIVI